METPTHAWERTALSSDSIKRLFRTTLLQRVSASYTRALFIYNRLLHLKASAHAEYPGRSVPGLGKRQEMCRLHPHISPRTSAPTCARRPEVLLTHLRDADAKLKSPLAVTETQCLWTRGFSYLRLDSGRQGIHSMKGEELIKSSLLMPRCL